MAKSVNQWRNNQAAAAAGNQNGENGIGIKISSANGGNGGKPAWRKRRRKAA